ncbi:hypothetical protein ACVWY2_000857 [Bradyrhizobium sp. JR6.1]
MPNRAAITDVDQAERRGAKTSDSNRAVREGRNEAFRPFFHASSQAVTGRFACRSLVNPARVISSVTPLPL